MIIITKDMDESISARDDIAIYMDYKIQYIINMQNIISSSG